MCIYLSQWNDKLTQIFLSTGKADVVVRNKHLTNDMHLSERRPERTVGVSIQTLVLCEPEQRSVPFILCTCIQVPDTREKHKINK